MSDYACWLVFYAGPRYIWARLDHHQVCIPSKGNISWGIFAKINTGIRDPHSHDLFPVPGTMFVGGWGEQRGYTSHSHFFTSTVGIWPTFQFSVKTNLVWIILSNTKILSFLPPLHFERCSVAPNEIAACLSEWFLLSYFFPFHVSSR